MAAESPVRKGGRGCAGLAANSGTAAERTTGAGVQKSCRKFSRIPVPFTRKFLIFL